MEANIGKLYGHFFAQQPMILDTSYRALDDMLLSIISIAE
jgi:hypothetical protein